MVCFTFMVFVSALFLLIRSLILPRTALAAENLALRQQLAILNEFGNLIWLSRNSDEASYGA